MPKPGKRKGQKSEVPKEEPPKEEPVQVPIKVEEDAGLGLGSTRKQKKEKRQQIYEASRKDTTSDQASTSVEQSKAPEETPVAKSEVKTKNEQVTPKGDEASKTVEKTSTKIEDVTEELDGLGLGGSKKKRPRKKKGDSAPVAVDSASVVTAAPAAVPVATAAPVPATIPAAAPVAAVIPAAGPAAGPAPPFVTSRAAPFSAIQQTPSSFSCPPPGFPPGLAPGTASQATPWGRGRGRGAGGPVAVAKTQSFLPSSQSSPQVGPPQQQFPQQQPVAASRPHTSQPPPPHTSQPPPPHTSQPPQEVRGRYAHSNIVCRYKIPLKIPGHSVNARRTVLITNYLEMTFKPLKISRYDVSFAPDRPKKMISEVFKLHKAKCFPKELISFDQMKNCYSLKPLPNVEQEGRFNNCVELKDSNGKLMKFDVSMKSTGVVDLSKIKSYMSERGTSALHPTEEVQCIDVILRQGTLESYVKAGRQFFKRPLKPIDLGHGYEMWTGLFQSAIFTSKAFINIDVAHKGFPKHQTMIEALKDFNLDTNMPIEKQRSYEIDNFLHFLKGLKVVAHMVGNTPSAGQKREYICNGLVDPPNKLEFTLNDPSGKQRKITVANYFAQEKKYQIKYPNLNCIWVGPKDKSIFFPMELLEVAYGQALAKQLNETQVSKMVREAATPPDVRLNKITEVISSMKYSTNQDFKKFGLDISNEFYEVNAKILEPPSLDIGRGSIVPRNGVWQANSLLKAMDLTAWGLIAIETQPNTDCENVIQLIRSTAIQYGMRVKDPLLKRFDVKMMSLNSVLRGAMDIGVKFLFVVVSMRGRDYYHRVKQQAEREVGMLTQCIKEATVRRMNPMTAKNILLKVNSKLMGVNQALTDRNLPRCLVEGGVMVVGADVTHPSPDQSNVPSIAAVTASIDQKCFTYNTELSIQTPKKEMIVEFEDMIFDHLKVYKERNAGQLPRKIFVFRDGVSEGQFVQVMNSELAAVHAAYQRMAGSGKKPEILFLLVQKRHHTRFFNKGKFCDKNVSPGTVVDTDIVHASELDFYLVSHQAIKGTARPTRYHAVCNDGRIPDDEVEQLTYYLCHLYSRCMRSVSYPAPTYYAHLACLRARSLTYGQKFNNKDLEKKPERLRVLDKMLQFSRMFFV